jgi:hypothetical protein
MMATRNDITGDALVSKAGDKAKYDEGYDRIWGKKKEKTFFEQIQEARELMVDPPSGWMYGFPALWSKDAYPELKDFLAAKGYPEKDIDFACSYMRMWLPDQEI